MKNQNISCTLLHSIPVKNQLGEGVIWHPQQQTLWWTDIEGKQLFCLSLDGLDDVNLSHVNLSHLKQWPVPERIGSFGFVAGSDDLIVAFESGLAFYNPQTEQIKWLGKPESDRPNNRFNDGRVDRDGRFWAGCMVEKVTENHQGAGLYRLDHLNHEPQISRQLDGLHISNGLCWSPDGATMYHADSPAQQIYRYTFDRHSGTPSDKQIFAKTPNEVYPDGATVDAQGSIWSAQWGGSRVVRYTPEGEISHVLSVPVSQPSCVCFGGPELNLLFVTTAKQGLSEAALESQPEAGNLLIYQTNVKGLEEVSYRT